MKILVLIKSRFKQILLVAIILVISFSLFKLIPGTRKPDIEIAYVTDSQVLPEKTEQNLKNVFFPIMMDVNGDDEKNITFTSLMGPRIDLEFAIEGAQIIVLNLITFEKYARYGVFDSLDDYILKNNIDISLIPEVKVTAEDSNEAHVYAIPIKDISFLQKNGFPVDDFYLCIRKPKSNGKEALIKNDNAHAILKEILANP